MKSIILITTLLVGGLVSQGGCGWRHACCCQPCCSSLSAPLTDAYYVPPTSDPSKPRRLPLRQPTTLDEEFQKGPISLASRSCSATSASLSAWGEPCEEP